MAYLAVHLFFNLLFWLLDILISQQTRNEPHPLICEKWSLMVFVSVIWDGHHFLIIFSRFFQFLRVFISKRSLLIFLSFHCFTSSLHGTLLVAPNAASASPEEAVLAFLLSCLPMVGAVVLWQSAHCAIVESVREACGRPLIWGFHADSVLAVRAPQAQRQAPCRRLWTLETGFFSGEASCRSRSGDVLVFPGQGGNGVSSSGVSSCASGWPTEELNFSPSCPSAHALLTACSAQAQCYSWAGAFCVELGRGV